MGRPRKPWPPRLTAAQKAEATRTCPTCERAFPPTPDFFYREGDRGLAALCIGCSRESRRRSHSKHREAAREASQTLQGRWLSIRNGARQRGIEWALTLADFERLWQQPCVYCGDEIPTIGLDRVDNQKGYTRQNVRACCGTCNLMKHALKRGAFLAHVKKITTHQASQPDIYEQLLALQEGRL